MLTNETGSEIRTREVIRAVLHAAKYGLCFSTVALITSVFCGLHQVTACTECQMCYLTTRGVHKVMQQYPALDLRIRRVARFGMKRLNKKGRRFAEIQKDAADHNREGPSNDFGPFESGSVRNPAAPGGGGTAPPGGVQHGSSAEMRRLDGQIEALPSR